MRHYLDEVDNFYTSV